MELYVCANSADSKTYFPDNTVGHFRVKLQRPLLLEGNWVMGLCEVHVTIGLERPPKGLLALHCNTCDGMIVGGATSNVIRTVQSKRHIHKVYTNVYYMPVETHFIESLEIYFRDSEGNPLSVVSPGVVECVLHFKRQNG